MIVYKFSGLNNTFIELSTRFFEYISNTQVSNLDSLNE